MHVSIGPREYFLDFSPVTPMGTGSLDTARTLVLSRQTRGKVSKKLKGKPEGNKTLIQKLNSKSGSKLG